MKKTIRPIIAFTVFIILFTVLFLISFLLGSFDFATSIFPGWHTTIYPPFFVWGITKIIILVGVIFGYWKLYRGGYKINKLWFLLHLALTIPSITDTLFPISDYIIVYNTEQLFESMEKAEKVILTFNSMFIIGQILFTIYYFKIKAAAQSGLA